MNESTIQCLVSLPPGAAAYWRDRPASGGDFFFAGDPQGTRLGSAGGAMHLLVEAWKATGPDISFSEWLNSSRKLIVLGKGQNRSLPAYSAEGEALIPIPALQGTYGHTLDQKLIDLQREAFQSLLAQAPSAARVIVISGDVLLRFDPKIQAFPEADVLMLGMESTPEIASHFGAFIIDRTAPERLAFMLQKASLARLRILAKSHDLLVDTGAWMLSERAVEVLLRRCGYATGGGELGINRPVPYELYSQFGLALGDTPQEHDPEIQALTCRVLGLPEPEFYHLGGSRQLIEGVCLLQNREMRHMAAGTIRRVYPNRVIQNTAMGTNLRDDCGLLWIENSTIPASWRLDRDHVLTGVPENDWALELEPGVCLDFIPIGEREFCLRAYGMDDPFTGSLQDDAALWFGKPARAWLEARGLSFAEAGLDPAADFYDAPLFPVLELGAADAGFIEWMFAAQPARDPDLARRWCRLARLSAAQVNERANLERIQSQRAENRLYALQRLYQNRQHNIFYRLDLDRTAKLFAESELELPPPDAGERAPLERIHDHMWRASILRRRGEDGEAAEEEQAFACLRKAVLENVRSRPARPQCNVLNDQIVWGRAPARLDFAGGWTDTPPYCLQHGGNVVNVAVDLNGQPPIQAFARVSENRDILIRSIDLGTTERVGNFETLETYENPGSAFALAKAALTLAGFGPRFYGAAGHKTLERQLDAFGGGIEISLLAAIPQGSGLGTSSILAATLLGTLSKLCGLHWDLQTIMMRTMALEQMLTTGGGWQDQAGGILRGLKQCRTAPGMRQDITVRWLPEYLIAEGCANGLILLYYTGVTRLAKNILKEIVNGMFLNEAGRLAVLRSIGENADAAAEAVQAVDWNGFCETIRSSWELNQRLDSGTNPPAIQDIYQRVGDYLEGAKLLGAGGGGYMVMLAKDPQAAMRIRQKLTQDPPNSRARFVDMSISKLGLEITKS